MNFKNTLFAAVSVLGLGATTPALAGEPHVGIHLVFGIPGVYVAPPPPVVVYPAPRPPVVVVQGHPHYHPRIVHHHGRAYYEGRRFKEVEHRREHRHERHHHRDGGRWERRGH